MSFVTSLSAIPQAKNPKLRALAVAGTQRLPQLPDVPTISEAGVPGYEFYAWFGLLAPKGTPSEVVNKLNAAMVAAQDDPQVQQQFQQLGATGEKQSPQQFGEFIQAEINKWAPVVQASGAKEE